MNTVLKYKVNDMQYWSEPLHHINQTVQLFWSDHSSVYLCYFHFNQPSGTSLKSEAICFSIFKNTYQHICTKYQMRVFFQNAATSRRQQQGRPALAVTSSFTWRQSIFRARMSQSSSFTKLPCSMINPYWEIGGSVLNRKQREGVLSLFSLLWDKGTISAILLEARD